MRAGAGPGFAARRAGVLVLAALALGLGGCAGFFYERLDWLATRWLDGYVDFDSGQRADARQRLAAQLEWNREHSLPEYAGWLRQLRQELPRGMSPGQVLARYQELEGFGRALAARGVDDAVELLHGLRPVQVSYLAEQLAEKNEELREEWVEPPRARVQAERRERLEKQLRRWFGRLNAGQQAALARWAEAAPPMGAARLEQRRRWQGTLLEALRGPRERARLRPVVERLLLRPESLAVPSYREQLAQNKAALAALLSTISHSLSEKQKRHFREEVDDWVETLDALSAPPATRMAEEPACRLALC